METDPMPEIDHNAWIMVRRNVKRQFGFELVVDDELEDPEAVIMVPDSQGDVAQVCIAGGPLMLQNFHRGVVAGALAAMPSWACWCLERCPAWFQSRFFRFATNWVIRRIRVDY